MKKLILASASAIALFGIAACSDTADNSTTQSTTPPADTTQPATPPPAEATPPADTTQPAPAQ